MENLNHGTYARLRSMLQPGLIIVRARRRDLLTSCSLSNCRLERCTDVVKIGTRKRT